MNILNIFKSNAEKRETNLSISNLFINNKILINKNLVEQIPSVQSNIKKICGSFASLPVNLIKKEYDKNVFIEDDIRLYILNLENNNFSTAYQMKYKIAEDLLFYGKSYFKIRRTGNKIIALHHIQFDTVCEKIFVDENGYIIGKDYNYTLNQKTLKSDEYDILEINNASIGILNSDKLLKLLLQYDESLLTAFENSTQINGVLQTSGRLTQGTIDKMKASWKSLYGGSNNSGKTVILEEGLEYKSIDIGLWKEEHIKSKDNFIDDVNRLFGTFNIKSDDDFLKYVLGPIVNCVENAFNKSLLLEKEKADKYSFKFDCHLIERLNYGKHLDTIAKGLDKGLYTINEARKELGQQPFLIDSNEEFLNLSMGKVMLKSDGTVILPNMATSIDMKTGQTNNTESMEDFNNE
ncbi:MAG: phage portal protein [Sarcina sp.]